MACSLSRVIATTLPGRRSFSAHKAEATLLGPAVRLLLDHYNINEGDVKPTGPKHNVLKRDVLDWINVRKLQPVAHSAPPPSSPPQKPIEKQVGAVGSKKTLRGHRDIPLSNMRRTIANRLTLSKSTVPHEYVTDTVSVTSLENLRKVLKKDGISVSLNDFIVKASANALRALPEMNVQWINEEAVPSPSVDISVAVMTPTGLITPIVYSADSKGVLEISSTVRNLAAAAKEGKLQPSQYQGGTFTISNLGMFGSVSEFTAIINLPQCAILTVGSAMPEVTDDLRQNKSCLERKPVQVIEMFEDQR